MAITPTGSPRGIATSPSTPPRKKKTSSPMGVKQEKSFKKEANEINAITTHNELCPRTLSLDELNYAFKLHEKLADASKLNRILSWQQKDFTPMKENIFRNTYPEDDGETQKIRTADAEEIVNALRFLKSIKKTNEELDQKIYDLANVYDYEAWKNDSTSEKDTNEVRNLVGTIKTLTQTLVDTKQTFANQFPQFKVFHQVKLEDSRDLPLPLSNIT